MPNITVLQQYITLIKDTVTCLAALVAAYVGFTGLQTWKRQLTANTEHDLARRVLVAVYKVRDAVSACRVPAWEGDSEIVDVTKKIHDLQFDKLDEVRASLDVELLEAEAVWGSELDYMTCMARLQVNIHQMKIAYSAYYSYYIYSETDHPNLREDVSPILFTKGNYPKDAFAISVDEAVSEVEDFLRPKLTLKQKKKGRWLHNWWDRLTKQGDWKS